MRRFDLPDAGCHRRSKLRSKRPGIVTPKHDVPTAQFLKRKRKSATLAMIVAVSRQIFFSRLWTWQPDWNVLSFPTPVVRPCCRIFTVLRRSLGNTDGNESNAKLVPIIDGLQELHQSGCKENRVLAVCQMLPDHAPMEVKN